MAYDYGFRIYSPSIAKFLSVDPLTQSYPWLTPYQFVANNPAKFIDMDGLEAAERLAEQGSETVLKVVFRKTVEEGAKGGSGFLKNFLSAPSLRAGAIAVVGQFFMSGSSDPENFALANYERIVKDGKELNFWLEWEFLGGKSPD